MKKILLSLTFSLLVSTVHSAAVAEETNTVQNVDNLHLVISKLTGLGQSYTLVNCRFPESPKLQLVTRATLESENISLFIGQRAPRIRGVYQVLDVSLYTRHNLPVFVKNVIEQREPLDSFFSRHQFVITFRCTGWSNPEWCDAAGINLGQWTSLYQLFEEASILLYRGELRYGIPLFVALREHCVWEEIKDELRVTYVSIQGCRPSATALFRYNTLKTQHLVPYMHPIDLDYLWAHQLWVLLQFYLPRQPQ